MARIKARLGADAGLMNKSTLSEERSASQSCVPTHDFTPIRSVNNAAAHRAAPHASPVRLGSALLHRDPPAIHAHSPHLLRPAVGRKRVCTHPAARLLSSRKEKKKKTRKKASLLLPGPLASTRRLRRIGGSGVKQGFAPPEVILTRSSTFQAQAKGEPIHRRVSSAGSQKQRRVKRRVASWLRDAPSV